MKGMTLLVLGLVLIAASVGVPKVLNAETRDIAALVTRVPGIICVLIGLIRISRESREKKF